MILKTKIMDSIPFDKFQVFQPVVLSPWAHLISIFRAIHS